MVRILGIDPGSRKAGFGLIETHHNQIKYLSSGVLIYDTKSDFLERLHHIYDSCQKLIETFAPNEIALESLIYVKNVSSLAKLAQARGAMIAAFSKNNRGKIFEYSPTLVKSSVTGNGHADKEAIQKGLRLIFGPQKFKSHDESDALAIAICHHFLSRQRKEMTPNIN
jgi:crossover junction endodeoxyribonuclease RuvC